MDNVQKKKENEREKRISREIQGCTFNPQLTSLPNYNNKKNKATSREQIDEENYYIKMKKARQIIQEKNKGDDLIERYDERRKKKNYFPRSMLTFANFNQDNNKIIPEESINNNYNNFQNWNLTPNSSNNMVAQNYKLNKFGKSNENFFNNNINNIQNEVKNDINMNKKINNNYINNNINNNYIGLNNNIFNNNINNNFIIDNKNNINNNNRKNYIIQNQNSLNVNNDQNNQNINYSHFINNNPNKKTNIQLLSKSNVEALHNRDDNNILNFENFFNENNSNKFVNLNINKNNPNNENINSNKQYINQLEKNNYDFDNNFTEEKIMKKIQINSVNNLNEIENILNPTIYNEEQEKENINLSSETCTKTNSILSLQKKSSHSLPDRSDKNENYSNLILNFERLTLLD